MQTNIPRIVRKDGRVTSAKVKSTRVGIADKGSRLRSALMEVEPLLSLPLSVSHTPNAFAFSSSVPCLESVYGC